MSFILSTHYVISATNTKGDRLYYALDSNSGGYPYWAARVEVAKTFKDLNAIPLDSVDKNMVKDMAVVEVLQIEMVAKVMNSQELVSAAKLKAMAEIAKIEQDLTDRVSKLKNMK